VVTWSIIANERHSGRVGIIVATRFFAVGAMVPHIRTGVGAVATQALINPLFGPLGLSLLARGLSAAATLAALTAADAGREHRQLHIMDANGAFAAFTGASCIAWCGHETGADYSVAGNMLAGPAVLAETQRAFAGHAQLPLGRRLIAAMHAGEAAGGDARGRQSAALLIHDQEDYPLYDLRVDDHPDPLAEIARLERVARERWVHFRRYMPGRRTASGASERSGLEALIARSIAEGYE
jgi:uncharacterized Ntn-hydrolase superfamily protein